MLRLLTSIGTGIRHVQRLNIIQYKTGL